MSNNPQYKHNEAFCLMRYGSDDGTEIEVLWNSRDGVTPFMIGSRLTEGMLRHIDWREDKCRPDFTPHKGMRIFVNATKELVTPKLNEYVQEIWNHKEYPAKDHWDSKQECFDALLLDWLHNGEAPWIVVVGG